MHIDLAFIVCYRPKFIEYVKYISEEANKIWKNEPSKTELTQRQKAIVLYFKEKAGVIPYQERHVLKEQENGSFALYNALCQVRNGNYKIDDLEAAIEFLIEFPTAHKLATEAFEKS